jgi:hypothetical protein
MTRSIARFKTLAGLGASAGGVRPGAGSLDGDKPAAIVELGSPANGE